MAHKEYDIFISYRRSETADKAEHLLSLLTADGYAHRVSFDKENLNGRFDLELLRRVDGCKDFILIISGNTFSFINEKDTSTYLQIATCSPEHLERLEDKLEHPDFVRIELARALAAQKNIIPIVPLDSNSFSFEKLALPEDIRGMKKYQAVFYSEQDNSFLFKDIVPKVTRLLSTKPHKTTPASFQGILRSLAVTLLVAFLGLFCMLWMKDSRAFSKDRSRQGLETYIENSGVLSFNRARAQKELDFILTAEEEMSRLPITREFPLSLSHAISSAQAKALVKILSCMVPIRAASFTMGLDKSLFHDASIKEVPSHSASVENYWIGRYEVAEDEWNPFMAPDRSSRTDYPICSISWEEAIRFTELLSTLTGIPFFLPSEAEWEYAAKGGTGFLYSGSDNPDRVAWYAGRDKAGTVPHPRNDIEGGLDCNLYDLFDMSGNVAEWCLDAFHLYGEAPSDNDVRVIRGGSVIDTSHKVRITYRDPMRQDSRSPYVGLRLTIHNPK